MNAKMREMATGQLKRCFHYNSSCFHTGSSRLAPSSLANTVYHLDTKQNTLTLSKVVAKHYDHLVAVWSLVL